MKTIEIKWSTEDVLTQAENIGLVVTEAEAEIILERLKDNHDATIGINWDVITAEIEYYFY